MAKPIREFWGLDFETSGVTHERHVPIQLGICAPNGDSASWLINPPWRWEGDAAFNSPEYVLGAHYWLWDARAFDVHGITKEKLVAEGRDLYTVTTEALAFIKDHSQVWKGQRKLVGWNVGSFDVPFLRKHLPGVARELSYQSADLNTLVFGISEAHGISSKQVKMEAQHAGAEGAYNLLGVDVEDGLHDAGWDAVAALGAWAYLKGRIADGY